MVERITHVMHALATTIATYSNLYNGGANIGLANFRIEQIIYLLINAFCLVVLVNPIQFKS